jgi:mono/diheme cytochrome c family protein
MKLTRPVLMTLTIIFAFAHFALGCDSDNGSSGADSPAESTFELNGNAADGAETYAIQCASCHGAEGKGDGPAGQALTPSPTDFTAQAIPAERAYNVIAKGGMSEGLAATMPGFERTLEDQMIRDLTAYIQAFAD